jgi:putative membrane protein
MMYGLGGLGMLFGLIFWLLVISALVGLIVWALRRSTAPASYPLAVPGGSAKDIAQQRYARGEITREQYQRILQDLEA